MYTIAFLKAWAFQFFKHHISTIYNLELCTPPHSSKYELFICPNVISQQSTNLASYVHNRIPQSTSFSIVQTSYLNNPQFRVMYTIAFLKVRAFQLSKRHISTIQNLASYVHNRIPQSTNFSIVQTSYLYLQNYPNGGTECLYYAMDLIWCMKVNISLVKNEDCWDMALLKPMSDTTQSWV